MLSGEERKLIRALHRQGRSHREIEADVGRSLGAIGRIVRNEAVGIRVSLSEWDPGGGRLTMADREDIAIGCAQGHTFAAIAAGLDRPGHSARHCLVANG